MSRKKEKRLPILGKNLNKLRGEMSQVKFAKHVGLTAATVGYYENSERLPDAETLLKICTTCGCTANYLLGIDDAPTPDVSGVCRMTHLAPETVAVLKLYDGELEQPASIGALEIKALNHIVANCNALLTHIGIYLFGDIIGAESVKIGNAAIELNEPNEYIRNGALKAVEDTLQSYRVDLQNNGGDLPLTAVLNQTQNDRKEHGLKKRIKFLEDLHQRKLTEAEIEQQRALFNKDGGADNGTNENDK